MKRWFASALMMVGYTVVSTTAAIAQEPKIISTVTYRCDEGKGFVAEYRDNETLRATFGSKVLELPQVESASGVRYSNGSVTVASKGDTAFVDLGDQRFFDNCVAVGRVSGLW